MLPAVSACSMASLRPILKRPAPFGGAPSSPQLAVHFPPSPSLTTHTFAAYSAAAYDRSPIQVSPNSCALPERGCPGRTYTLDESASHEPASRRYHSSRGLHPRALKPRPEPPMPSLIPDLSSESDESDAFSSPSCCPVLHLYPVSPTALSFLPHPPSPPSSRSTFDDDDDDEHPVPKPRRRRERKHDPSRTPDRIPDAPDCPILRTPTKKRVTRALQLSSFPIDDDGCLGGF
ncbi:hypothetical protein C0989_010867 [Termitomyces sp. Mn162]|nr:hypothetical protein C0989_010867 [Termitomyces sp. Mn162]